jgi:energy-coupling factor transporter ATP-binding protein EcfA2
MKKPHACLRAENVPTSAPTNQRSFHCTFTGKNAAEVPFHRRPCLHGVPGAGAQQIGAPAARKQAPSPADPGDLTLDHDRQSPPGRSLSISFPSLLHVVPARHRIPAAMEDGTADPQPPISSYETFMERLREAAANEYGPAYRAMQNYSTEAHASRSMIGSPGPEADLLARPRSPEPQDFTAGWPEPDSNFIGTISEELDIPRSCRICGAEADVHPASLLMCAGCGPAHSPVHKHCLRHAPRHCLRHAPRHRLLGPGRQPRPRRGKCEEVPFKEYAYLSWLLDSQYRQEDSDSLHLDDLRTKWFGVPHDQKASSPKLSVWPRLQAILNNAAYHLQYQFPSLVSFVGDTGSGKSTIIKAMIRMSAPKSHGQYQVPVPGTGQDQFTSTSSDVQLYADPWTVSTEVPIVMADCEGLFGTSTPVSRRIVSDEYRKQPSCAPPLLARGMDDMVRDHLKKASMEVSLAWARVDHPRPLSARVDLPSDAPEPDPRHSGTWSDISDASSKTSSAEPLGFVQANSRDLITKSLYPRLLYAFSDVVCFVTHNTRYVDFLLLIRTLPVWLMTYHNKASQDIMWKLFKWSQDGLERTFNQRARPGLIIIVNSISFYTNVALSNFYIRT